MAQVTNDQVTEVVQAFPVFVEEVRAWRTTVDAQLTDIRDALGGNTAKAAEVQGLLVQLEARVVQPRAPWRRFPSTTRRWTSSKRPP